ncbi:hypothetical protein QUF70_20015, partial [Desulfobacterales bacterium HSG17]|nr:hypothetical protein [Desulfobacterales bacterium HSG17]
KTSLYLIVTKVIENSQNLLKTIVVLAGDSLQCTLRLCNVKKLPVLDCCQQKRKLAKSLENNSCACG